MQIGLTSQATPQSSCDNVAFRNLRDDVMNSLKEKLREASDPLAGSTVSLSNYLDRTGTATEALFGARRSLGHEREDEPLPSMSRETPPESDPVKAPNLFHYIATALVLWSVCAAAAYFTAAIPLTDKGAVKPITKVDVDNAATPNRGVTASSQADPQAWNDAVETLRRLAAEQKASPAPSLQQTENQRVLGQLEAWSKAKPRQ
jgi:hypothetical protein